ncbi:MAG: polysaccharide pyruvyl transferase family protein [Loktanella sp.]|nr:polysaccharide pyruvyl transferase family protein [Loktanella sp.]
MDFPDHSNVGDSAIFLGELSLLTSLHGVRPSYVCSMRSHFNDLESVLPDGPIYLHGGGNFGDLWPAHQSFREAVIRRYPHRKIIQLPQSIHFRQAEALDQSASIIDKHPDFTLLVRDKESFVLAKEKFACNVLLCPDAAHDLGPLQRSQEADHPILCIIRTDSESGLTPEQIEEVGSYGPLQDWVQDRPQMKARQDRLVEEIVRKLPISRRVLRPALGRVYEKWAQDRLDRGVSQLSAAEFVITDRLHVHILCRLLGIPHIVFDNNYGKISRYVDAWPKSELAHVARNIDDFRKAIDRHLSQQ